MTTAVSVLLLAAFTQPAGAATGSASMLQTDCSNPPAIMAVDDIEVGMTGKAYTTLVGRDIAEFDIEVLGVLPGAVYPLIDLILIEASGPAVEAVGGIAGGFSGSPVYVDGKLIGAVAYGFFGNSFIAGVTPAESIVELGSFPATAAPQLNDAARQALDLIEAAVGPVGAPQPLPTPVGVAGSQEWIEKLQTRASEMGLPITVFPAPASINTGSSSNSPGVILPGESLSAVLSEGDNAAYGTGTATYCDGSTVIGFGHPLLWTGEVSMSMNEADVIVVLQNSTGWGNFKIVTLGEPVGRIDFDGSVGIRGISGEMARAVPITSSVQFAEYGTTRDGTTDAYMADSLFYSLGWVSAGHLLTNLDNVSGTGFRPGSSKVEWEVEGTRQDGAPFRASFDNLYWDGFSITDNSIYELASFVDLLVFNPFEDVAITSVDIGNAELFTDRRTVDIKKVQAWTTTTVEPVQEYGFLQAMPGDTVTAEVTLRSFGESEDVVETIELEIPADFEGGYGSLWIHGGSSEGLYFDPYYADYLPGGAADFDELLEYVEGRNRNSDLVAELTLYPSYVTEVPVGNGLPEPPADRFVQTNGGGTDTTATTVKDVIEFDAVVRGDRYFDLEVLPEVPPVVGTLVASLSGANEVGGGDADGTGSVIVNFEGDTVRFDITLEGVDEPITGAHIHSGPAGEDGPVVVDLEFEANGLSGVVAADPYLLEGILAAPEAFYVNVHSEAYPDGAVRGQLSYEQAEGSALAYVTAGGLWQLSGHEPFYFGIPGDLPFLGDWDGDGIETPGLYRPSSGFAYVRNSNDTGVADASFFFGVAGDTPIVGDWDGDGIDTFGVYRPAEAKMYLRNSNGTGPADVEYHFGVRGDTPFTGDFDGNGITDLGLHRTTTGLVYLRLSHTTGLADLTFHWGVAGDQVLAGDWDGDGIDTLGLVRPSTGMFYYRNTNSTGVADGDWPIAATSGSWTIVD